MINPLSEGLPKGSLKVCSSPIRFSAHLSNGMRHRLYAVSGAPESVRYIPLTEGRHLFPLIRASQGRERNINHADAQGLYTLKTLSEVLATAQGYEADAPHIITGISILPDRHYNKVCKSLTGSEQVRDANALISIIPKRHFTLRRLLHCARRYIYRHSRESRITILFSPPDVQNLFPVRLRQGMFPVTSVFVRQALEPVGLSRSRTAGRALGFFFGFCLRAVQP